MHAVLGGLSAIDVPRLTLQTLEEAQAFIEVYGFVGEDQQERLWHFHRRAMVLLTEKLHFSSEQIPAVVQDRKELKDLRRLLLWASSVDPREQDLQKWSCAILRAMHVFIHSEMDLFSTFSEEIQKQILTPFQDCVFHDGTASKTFLKKPNESLDEGDALSVVSFETKPFKTSSSTVIKLLAKRDALAMNVFDKLGVRFVTNSIFDSFRVVRFLLEENLISAPHVIPDQSSNNVYPIDLFLHACEKIREVLISPTDEEVQKFLEVYLDEYKGEVNFLRKENAFSGHDYRFIKFIARRLVKIPFDNDKKTLSFYYPFEVQILDESSYQVTQSGPSEHQAYKERQRQAARLRILGEDKK